MAEHEFKLKGWQAIIVLVALIAVVAVRFMSLSDNKDDANLIQNLEIQLASDYLPGYVGDLKSMYEAGDNEGVQNLLKESSLDINSIQTSYPVFEFTSTKEVVVKVIYSFGNTKNVTKYFLYQHSSAGNHWSYQRESNSLSYYLNFM